MATFSLLLKQYNLRLDRSELLTTRRRNSIENQWKYIAAKPWSCIDFHIANKPSLACTLTTSILFFLLVKIRKGFRSTTVATTLRNLCCHTRAFKTWIFTNRSAAPLIGQKRSSTRAMRDWRMGFRSSNNRMHVIEARAHGRVTWRDTKQYTHGHKLALKEGGKIVQRSVSKLRDQPRLVTKNSITSLGNANPIWAVLKQIQVMLFERSPKTEGQLEESSHVTGMVKGLVCIAACLVYSTAVFTVGAVADAVASTVRSKRAARCGMTKGRSWAA